MELEFRVDLPAPDRLFRLFQSTGWNQRLQLSEAQVQEAMSRSWYSISAYRGGELVGFGRLLSDGVYQCFVCDMIVLPDAQGQGIGQAILERLVAHAQDSGIKWLQLTCALGKQGFYTKSGFSPRPEGAPGMERWLA